MTCRGGSMLAAAVLVASGCTAGDQQQESSPSTGPAATTRPTTGEPTAGHTLRPRPLRPGDFDAGQAMAVVRHLAADIGPRHGTSPEFRTAARWVARRLERLGYDVRRQQLHVPAGTSWGVRVPAGRSVNVIAAPPGFEPSRAHLVVGAHLDTVPQAPGAEDNGSGVGVLVAAAAAVADAGTRLPVVWVAFGAEEPRGPTDDDHHYGSRAYVATLSGLERRAIRGMVALDRVGVGERVPVGSAQQTDPLQRSLLAAGRRAGVPATADPFSRSSDHWSFVRAGLPGARLGSTPYAGYHSPGDVPAVVDPAQLGRTGRLLLAWLR